MDRRKKTKEKKREGGDVANAKEDGGVLRLEMCGRMVREKREKNYMSARVRTQKQEM